MVLLIDFDGDPGRFAKVVAEIPARLSDRVFVLGAWLEPEGLRVALSLPLESLGSALAQACRDNIDGHWSHKLLQHNA